LPKRRLEEAWGKKKKKKKSGESERALETQRLMRKIESPLKTRPTIFSLYEGLANGYGREEGLSGKGGRESILAGKEALSYISGCQES